MLEFSRHHLGWLYRMRSIYLFISLILFISMVQFVDASVVNQRMIANLLNVFVLMAAVAAVGRTRFSFVLALLLTVPIIGFQWLGLSQGEHSYILWSWTLGALFYLITPCLLAALRLWRRSYDCRQIIWRCFCIHAIGISMVVSLCYLTVLSSRGFYGPWCDHRAFNKRRHIF